MNEGIQRTLHKLETLLANPAGEKRQPQQPLSPVYPVEVKRTIRVDKNWTQERLRSRSPSLSPSPKSNRGLQPFSETEIRMRPLKIRPMTAPVARSQPVVISPVEGLTFAQLKKIYNAKCQDLCIPILPDQERRFMECCGRTLKDRRFVMREFGLGAEAGKVIGELLRTNMNFARIELARNVLRDNGAITLVKLIMKSPHIVHLDISSNDISPEGSAKVIRKVVNHPSIVSLDISSHEGLHRNRLGSKGCEPLVKLLSANPILAFLNLGGTSITPEGLHLLSRGLNGNKSLVVLNLSNNSISGRYFEEFCRTICSTSLQELSIASNHLDDDDMEPLASMLMAGFESVAILKKLDLSRNRIGPLGIGVIYNALKSNAQLRHLNLERNPLGPTSISNLTSFLLDNTVLNHINWTSCDLRSNVVNSIGDGLARNHGLGTIILMANGIDDEGAKALSQGLLKNDGLTMLDLSFNKISDEGGSAIANCLRANRKLERLLLRDNNLHDSTGQLLVEVTRYNRSLLKASLDNNPINYKYIREIKTNLKRNREAFQKNLAPMLRRQLKAMQIRENALDELLVDLERKKNEAHDAEARLYKQTEQLERFKLEEEQKYEEVHTDYERTRQEHSSLAEELQLLEDELRKVKLKGEQEVRNWEDKLANMAADLNKLTKENAATKQEFSLKRSQNQLKLDAVQQVLDEKLADKRRVEYSIKILREQIDKQKVDLENVNKPDEEAKTFLASEKLASSKKPKRVRSANRSARPKSKRGGR
mmetsp:Transcript_19024/g.34580  ORF Transcript_19024/g.34580 Transcript_19024/m.34580 type:complete len:765 (-) Transcript_19024:460-2754(-)